MLRGLFSGCGEQGLVSSCGAQASHCSDFSWCRAWLQGAQAQWLWLLGSSAQAQCSWCTGLVAPQHVGSSWIRDWPHAPAVAGGFFTTEPPGKPLSFAFWLASFGMIICRSVRVAADGMISFFLRLCTIPLRVCVRVCGESFIHSYVNGQSRFSPCLGYCE